MPYIIKKITPHFLINLCCAFFIISLLLFGKGRDISAILLVLITYSFAWRIKKQAIPQGYWNLAVYFVAFFALFLMSIFVFNASISDLDNPSRFIFVLIIGLTLLQYPPSFSWLSIACGLSSIIAAIVAHIQTNYFNISRAFTGKPDIFWFDGFMPIQDGDIAMSLSLFCLCFSLYYLTQKRWMMTVFLLLGFLSGLYASLLSGSRGAWIAFPPIILYLCWSYRAYLKNKKVLIIGLIALTTLLFSAAQSKTFQQRIQKASYDIALFKKGNTNSSLGIRIELWKSALLTAKESPIWGVGYQGRIASRQQQYDSGLLSPTMPKRMIGDMHAHNQYLEYLSVFGLLGLLILLGIFLYPLWLFTRNSSSQSEHKALTQCGIIHIITVMSYCLTQAFFSHHSGVLFYLVMVIIWLTSSHSLTLKNPLPNKP